MKHMKLVGAVVLLALAGAVGCAAGEDGQAYVEAMQNRTVDEQAAAHLDVAQRAYRHGDYSTALALADSAVGRDPALAEAHFYRGLVLLDLNRFDEADSAFAAVLERDPYYRGVWYKRGTGAFLQGQYREAIDYFRQEEALLASSPPAVKAFYEDVDAAALPSVYLQIGRSYEKLSIADSTRLAYEAALQADSSRATAHAWLSELDEDEGRLDEALAHARKAQQLEPDNLEYQYRTGLLLYRTGELQAALGLLAPVAEQQPWHEGANYNLGQVLLRLGRDADAKAYLDRAESLQTLQSEIAQAQAAAYQQSDRLDRWVHLATLLVRTGRYDEAARALDVALYLDPMNVALHNDRANVALAQGDTAGALIRFHTLLRYDSTFADAWLNLGVVHALSGELDRAREAWEAALRYAPGHPEATAYLARLDEQSGS
jgi:tetratricopeptide (TPR) repeat protein